MDKNRHYIYFPIYFALTLLVGIFLGILLIPSFTGGSSIFSFGKNQYNKINDVIQFIESDYVDTVSRKSLTQKAIIGMLQSLDPHSAYIDAADFKEANDPLMGNFEGIGIQFRVIRDSITVINVIKGGPSELAGLTGGDRIVQIDGKKSCNIKIKDEEVIKKLKGPRGSKVALNLYRKSSGKYFTVTITRNIIPTQSIDIAFMATPQIGYIKLSKFSATTIEEMGEAIKSLKAKGMKKLVFDLRSNGGGFLDAAVSISDEFLADKKLIVYTEGLHRSKKSYYATANGMFENNEMVVLIDEFSASASEIVAGAIQDNDRGTIIGRRSFGKGLVQEQVTLSDGSALRLTVARYHTPTGRCIQKPYNGGFQEYYEQFYERLMEEDASLIDSLNYTDTLKYNTPKGKIVYGGGGIMPDIYIPNKVEYPIGYYRKIINKGLIQDFAFDYTDKNRTKLILYRNAKNFIENFHFTPALYEEFFIYAEKKGLPRDKEGQKQIEKILTYQLKGAIGRNLFDDEAFYPIILQVDKVFEKAISVLNLKP